LTGRGNRVRQRRGETEEQQRATDPEVEQSVAWDRQLDVGERRAGFRYDKLGRGFVLGIGAR